MNRNLIRRAIGLAALAMTALGVSAVMAAPASAAGPTSPHPGMQLCDAGYSPAGGAFTAVAHVPKGGVSVRVINTSPGFWPVTVSLKGTGASAADLGTNLGRVDKAAALAPYSAYKGGLVVDAGDLNGSKWSDWSVDVRPRSAGAQNVVLVEFWAYTCKGTVHSEVAGLADTEGAADAEALSNAQKFEQKNGVSCRIYDRTIVDSPNKGGIQWYVTYKLDCVKVSA